jgi:hypothetical protein
MTAEGHTSLIPATSAPRRRRRWPWMMLPVLLSLGILGGIYVYNTYSGNARLQRAVAEADRLDPGWRFAELEARRPEVPDEENAILHVLAARNYLPFPKPVLALDEKLHELAPPEQLHAQEVRDITVQLTRVKPALDQARQNSRLSTGRYPLAHTADMIGTLLPNVDGLTSVRVWLWLDVCRRAQERDFEGALESARAMFNSARGIGDELFMVSQNTRQARVCEALRMLERILAQGEVSDRPLAEFQRLIREEEAFPSLLIGMRGERAVLDLALQSLESREAPVTGWRQMNLFGKSNFSTGNIQVDDMVYRYSIGSLKEIRASLLEYFTQVVEVAKLPVEELETRRDELDGLFEKQPPKVKDMFGPFRMNAILIYERTRAELRSADVMLALERYRMAHGRWPETLADLVPDYLPKIPLDPYDAAPLRYRKLDDGCVVYSIGADRRDQGGNIVRTSVGIKTPGNFGFRLWNVNARRQPADPSRLQGN